MVKKQGIRTELEKVKDPNKKVFSRRSYYTDISYIINEIEISHPVKVDTGSPYTVVGLKHPAVAMVKDIILDSKLKDIPAYDATNSEIILKCFVVENFKLTNDIIFPRIKIHFSEELDDKCILGMDILSIFDFHYKKDSTKMSTLFSIFSCSCFLFIKYPCHYTELNIQKTHSQKALYIKV